MSAGWFSTRFPASRFVIEGDLRSAFWKAGYGDIWVSCTKDEVPYECQGYWHGKSFTLEWDPSSYLLLKTPEPDQDMLDALERVLRRKALAAYKDNAGTVTVEWRARNADVRFEELTSAGTKDLERLN